MSNEANAVQAPATEEKRVRNDAETFVTVWEASGSVGEVAQKLGITKSSAAARATKFRGKDYNIPLKNMPKGGGRRLNLEKLRGLCKPTAPAAQG